MNSNRIRFTKGGHFITSRVRDPTEKQHPRLNYNQPGQDLILRSDKFEGHSLTMDGLKNSWTAPFYTVPSRQLVSVEHPAIVRNVDKAIETLQGDAGIKSVRMKSDDHNRL